MAEVKCIVGYPSPPKTTQVTSDAYLIKWVEQVDIQPLRVSLAVCVLRIGTVLERRLMTEDVDKQPKFLTGLHVMWWRMILKL